MKKEDKIPRFENSGAAVPVSGQPETAEELVNKYGTYNIQPTAESENRYPEIAQGYSKYRHHETDGEGTVKDKRKRDYFIDIQN